MTTTPKTDSGHTESSPPPNECCGAKCEHPLSHDLVECLRNYAREKPEVAALWCFGIGFVLGWKLKPW